MTTDEEWETTFTEYHEKTGGGLSMCMPIPDGQEGIDLMRRCIAEGKTYEEMRPDIERVRADIRSGKVLY